MILWFVANTIRRAFRRLALEAIGVTFPVALFAATLLFVDSAVQAMTPLALRSVQIEMRAIAKTLQVDIGAASQNLTAVPGVRSVERFASADVLVAPGPPGTPGQVTARLFAIDPQYLTDHPWVQVANGRLDHGALLDQAVRALPEFATARTISIRLPGDAPALRLEMPVGGTVDLREAPSWFAIPYGGVQGDIVTLPRAIVIDYATFNQQVLPVLRSWESSGSLPPFDPGAGELAPASVEAHITIDHSTYPPDPGQALTWSGQLQRKLERAGAGSVIVADNAADSLITSQDDATNAKVLFLLLGLPGVLIAAGVGLTAASALVEAHRREEALLQLRGATSGELAALASVQAAVTGAIGCALGLLIAIAVVSMINGRAVWEGIPSLDLWLVLFAALVAGSLIIIVRLLRLWRASRRSDVENERRLFQRGWSPAWWRLRLDLVAIAVGLVILLIDYLSGGLSQAPIEGTTLALAFYVLLAPLALWLGVSLLAVRLLLSLITRWARPERSTSLSSWPGAALLWLGRRPAQTASALALGVLAVAFGVYVLTFTATYESAKQSEAQAAIGSDLRLTAGDPSFTLPSQLPGVGAVSPVRLVSARVGSDRKSILAIDLSTYSATATVAPRILAGQGPERLAKDPQGVLVNSEIAFDFSVGPGDSLPLTIFPDDLKKRRDLNLRVVGIFGSFAPTSPPAELVASVDALPDAPVLSPDFYLARVNPERPPEALARDLRAGPLANKFGVTTSTETNGRGLTALSLDGLSRMETFGAGLAAALAVAALGGFMILERRRETAILRSMGADSIQVLVGPALEGSITVLGSLVIGVPIGIGLGILAIQVLGLFFELPPPLVTLPSSQLVFFALFMLGASAVALGAALVAVHRVRLALVLKES